MKTGSRFPKHIRRRLEYLAYLVFTPFVRSLSHQSIIRLGRLIGTVGNVVARKRKQIARVNLDVAFGSKKTPRQKELIIKNSFIQLATSAMQCWWLGRDPENRIRQVIDGEPEGLDELQRCLDRKKGVFFLTAHYGNWEAMGVNHGYLKTQPLYSIARKLDNPYLEKVALKFRTLSGSGILYKDQSPIKMLRALKKNYCVAVMMDQNMAVGGVFVDFFGRRAATARSIAVLSYSTGAPIMALFSYPTGKGTYRIKYGPELKLERTGNKEEDVKNWTQACEHYLQGAIEEYPEPWMWGHRRWKTRPDDEKNLDLYRPARRRGQ